LYYVLDVHCCLIWFGNNVLAGTFWALLSGDCDRIMTGGTIGGNVIASQLLGWPAGQLYNNLYNPS